MVPDNTSDRDYFYALARTPEEAERLHLQAMLWKKATSTILDQLQIPVGMSCLDLGCGVGLD